MSNLEEYIEKVKKYIAQNSDISETEIVRYVYLDLGKRFSFNENFLPFGNSKKRQNLYKYHSSSLNDLEECMETNTVICKSVTYILEYVLTALGINIKAVVDTCDNHKCPHMHNIITPKNGTPYMVDLQEDMYRIKSHSFTKNFGLSVKDEKSFVISRFEQEQIDRKIGYIDDENYYSDDYLYLLKYDANQIEDFEEKVKFVLENIDIYNNPNFKYTDRQWHHKSILEELFTEEEFNYAADSGKIRMIDCYKDVDNERYYLNCIAVQIKGKTQIYVYNKKEYRYCQIDFMNFAKAVHNGLVLHNCNLPGLKKITNNFKER